MKLAESNIEEYKHEGLTIPDYKLSEKVINQLSDDIGELVEAFPEIPSEYLVGPHIFNEKCPIDGLNNRFMDVCTNAEILDFVESVIGPDIILWSSGVFCKKPNVGLEVPWHQDGHFWPIRPLATCTVWIAVDDATKENGCMRYLPGSHKEKQLFKHHYSDSKSLVLNQEILNSEIDELKVKDDLLERGQMSLHDVYLVHGSNRNQSDKRRAGYAIRYMPASSVFDRSIEVGQSSSIGTSEFANRPIWLVRGRDTSGKNNFQIGHL